MSPRYHQPNQDTAGTRSAHDTNICGVRASIGKRLATSLSITVLVLASGPVLWLVILVIFGIIRGEPLQVFHNQAIWENEFVAKIPAALFISSIGAISVFVGILTERHGNNMNDEKNKLD